MVSNNPRNSRVVFLIALALLPLACSSPEVQKRRHFERGNQYAAEKRDQFAAELIYFSDCIVTGREPEPSGWEGLADVRIIRGLQHSIERRRPVLLPRIADARHPSPEQRIDRPPVAREPELVHARAASE